MRTRLHRAETVVATVTVIHRDCAIAVLAAGSFCSISQTVWGGGAWHCLLESRASWTGREGGGGNGWRKKTSWRVKSSFRMLEGVVYDVI